VRRGGRTGDGLEVLRHDLYGALHEDAARESERVSHLLALAAASRLRAKLLVLHGTADDNVHMQNSMNFLDALVKAGHTFELQIQPGQHHGFSGDAAQRVLVTTLADFFRRNLAP
jgi:dipeptidyl aminopeptidase/acylaminoacyl peptidase